ncbi:hypothetical protein MY10362_007822 [Beauveria mimosiformis]
MLASVLYSLIRHKQYGQTHLFQLAGLLASEVILNHPYREIALAQVSAATTRWSSEDLGAYYVTIATPLANADEASDYVDDTEEH